MNVVPNNREQEEKVVSKYFINGKPVMDESITDFKEPKNKCSGPKNSKTAKIGKPKAKPRTTKKIKGQKDIRTALKNDIVKYTKDFSDVCRKSGIDFDSEQLQLAIVLSKSLHEPDADNNAHTSRALTVQQRAVEIRKTLRQYGFKVPINVKATGSRRLRKYKKVSKLLLTSFEEKGQIVADKYAQVIFQNLQTALFAKRNSQLYNQPNTVQILYKTSDINYRAIKNTKEFYIENLIEEYPNSVGSLLRDWADIPGRPLSPIVANPYDFEVIDLDITDEEMDVLLSGKLEVAQKVVIDKINERKYTKDILINNSVEELDYQENAKNCLLKEENVSREESTQIEDSQTIKVQFQYSESAVKISDFVPRCESPDLFDDELSIDISKDVIPDSQTIGQENEVVRVAEPVMVSQMTVGNVTRKNSNDSVNQTEYGGSTQRSVKIVDESISFTQTNNVIDSTRRRSDDFMEITECVREIPNETALHVEDSTMSITINKNITRRKSDDFMEITDCVAVVHPSKVEKIEENIDLTQISDSKNDDTIMIKELIENPRNYHKEEMDLTQSTDSDDSLPFVFIGGTTSNKTITSYEGLTEIKAVEPNKCRESICDNALNTTEPIEEVIHVERQSSSSKSSNVFDEFEYEHSRSSPENKTSVDLTDYSATELCRKVDLNQSSNESTEEFETHTRRCANYKNQDDDEENIDTEFIPDDYLDIVNDQPIEYNCSKDNTMLYNVDLDNEELFTPIKGKLRKAVEINSETSVKQSNIEEEITSCKQNSDAMSQNSEVFEISDEELNYSVHKSKNYSVDNSQDLPETQNFDFGGLSVLDEIGSLNSFRNSRAVETCKAIEADTLPIADIQGTKVKSKSFSEQTDSPLRNPKGVEVQTPKNSGFLIKVDQVTPIGDYAGMSTPERNTELDKFGLKPLKRKRAIQILTHLYNQTHPMVEDTGPSTSKKQKIVLCPKKNTFSEDLLQKDESNANISPKNTADGIVNDTNMIQGDELIKENDKYLINDKPVVRDIGDCDPEDWVFQKREKAKVHSCRVPLHVALHNHVLSCTELREDILRYEPVNIEEIHKHLVGIGQRYDPKDLLKFLDKKCITVKTAENNTRSIKQTQKKS